MYLLMRIIIRRYPDKLLFFFFKKPEEEIRCAEWHSTDSNRIGIVLDNYVSIRDVNTGSQVTSVAPEGRARLKFTGGKWSPQGHCQVRNYLLLIRIVERV